MQSIMTAHIVVASVGETPATMSREILHDLLRGELGFDGMVMTDALEMQAISATVGVEEGAVRAIAAGADALCLGHDLFDESVMNVRDALVEAVRLVAASRGAARRGGGAGRERLPRGRPEFGLGAGSRRRRASRTPRAPRRRRR